MSFLQELLDCVLQRAVTAFARTVIADVAFGVNQEAVGPGRIVVGAPDQKVVVNRNRIRQPKSLDRSPHVRSPVSNVKLRTVNADDFKPILVISLVPLLVFSEGANAVDAGVLPEVDQNNLTSQPG